MRKKKNYFAFRPEVAVLLTQTSIRSVSNLIYGASNHHLRVHQRNKDLLMFYWETLGVVGEI